MTLIIALGCSDGVVMAADSAASDPAAGIKTFSSSKVSRIGSEPILYGGSGDVGLSQHYVEALQGVATRGDARAVREQVCNKIGDVLKRYHSRVFDIPGATRRPAVVALLAGVHKPKPGSSKLEPWIMEVNDNGGDTLYSTDDFGYFAAIGSGATFAHALMRSHLEAKRTVEQAKVLAYRLLDDAILLSESGLALPIHIHSISLDGEVITMDAEEQSKIVSTVELWRELEKESLSRAFARDVDLDSMPATLPTLREEL